MPKTQDDNQHVVTIDGVADLDGIESEFINQCDRCQGPMFVTIHCVQVDRDGNVNFSYGMHCPKCVEITVGVGEGV